MKFADRIILDLPNRAAEAHFFVAPDADFLADHFPGMPMLPGLVMLETAVCAARALLAESGGDATAADFDLNALERFYVLRRVAPNETVVTRVEFAELAPGGDAAHFTASATVGEEEAMRAKFRIAAALNKND